MALVEDDDVIQTLAANRTDHALDVRVLPGGSRCRDDFLDPHRSDPVTEVGAIRCVAIAQQITRDGVPRECFGHLAREPSGGRMLGYSRAYDLPAIVRQNDHDVEQLKRSGRYNEHIDRSDAFGLIAQEAPPSRGRRTSSSYHVLGDCGLADLDAELEQLAMDPGRTPERGGAAHLPNQIANFAIHRRPPGSRTPAPKQAEALTMPVDDGGRPDQHHRLQTARPQSVEQDPEQAVGREQPGPTRPLATKNAQLMTEGQIL